MPELDFITVKGFKSIASIERVELGSTNVLVGANGSGKSNFIGVFSFLHAIREGHLRDYVARAGGADKILHFGSRVTNKLQIHISFGGSINQYEISLQPTSRDELYPSEEKVSFWDRRTYDKPYSEDSRPAQPKLRSVTPRAPE